MTGKAWAGLILIVAGLLLAMLGVDLMTSLLMQVAGTVGGRGNRGPVILAAGGLLVAFGVVLVVRGTGRRP
jgi:hypothetical protein